MSLAGVRSAGIARSTVAEMVAAALATLAAVVTGDVALIALAAPLALAAVIGLSVSAPSLPTVAVSVDPLLASTGEPIEVSLEVTSSVPQLCTIELAVPHGTKADGPTCWGLSLQPYVAETVSVKLTTTRPGRPHLGHVTARSEAAAPGRSRIGQVAEAIEVEVRPDPIRLRELARSRRVRAHAGDQVGRMPGEGIEFAEVREQPAGAMERRINWRATARRGSTCVNLYHPERNTDVMLLADTFSAAALPSVLRICVQLAESYLARHDRLGLVCFGGVLDWVEPGSGPAHADRVLASLLSSESYFSYAWKTADLIPRRLVPPGCLVLAVTPLTDERIVRTLADLRARGLEVAVVEVAPVWPEADARSERLATRIINMERDDLRRSFWSMGVPLATIAEGEQTDVAIARLVAMRRVMQRRATA